MHTSRTVSAAAARVAHLSVLCFARTEEIRRINSQLTRSLHSIRMRGWRALGQLTSTLDNTITEALQLRKLQVWDQPRSTQLQLISPNIATLQLIETYLRLTF